MKKKMNHLFSWILVLCMVLSLVTTGVSSTYGAETQSSESSTGSEDSETTEALDLNITELDGSDIDVDLTDKTGETTQASVTEAAEIDEDELVPVIIMLEGDSVVEADSFAELNNETEEMMEELEESQQAVIDEIEESVLDGEPLDVSYSYTWLINGVAATVPYGKVSEIAALEGVKKVLFQRVYEVCETEEEAITDISYPMTVSDGAMIGRESTWDDGYKGDGITIAIIDTGIDSDHQNFGPLDESVAVSATPETIGEKLADLNASDRYPGLTVDDVYYSTKIAYGFNYCDYNLNITHDNDEQGDHGTHVAGIAAANKVEGSDVVGVAPNAQLYIMKVFGENGGAYTEDIVAALEDALILGADVVNMSLGSPAGFTAEGDDGIDEIYALVSSTGTILAVSAGNSYTMGYGNAWYTDENLTENVDNSVIASPGTYVNVLSVASVENSYYLSDCITVGDYNIGYSDGSYGSNAPLSDLAGQDLGIVAVPGNGEESDYEGLDVTGKIALVQRGTISFVDKCENAEAAGAVACLIYNNTSGTIGMDLTDCTATIPCASITQADGAYLISALEENPDLTVTVGEEMDLIASSVAGQMSDFSSWGVAPDLSMEPDITAPGGNIYSTLDGGTYGLMSGTSMASPNVAGLSALVVQYIKENYGLSGTELHNRVKALLMSTSDPLTYADGSDDEEGDSLYYSPREQGSGLANAYSSVTTEAYLSVDGCDTPKAELGDDADRTGSYSFTYDVNNFGERDLFYDLDTVAQTEDVDDTYAEDEIYFMSSTPRALDAATAESSDNLVLTYDVDDSNETDSHDAYLIYQAAVAGDPVDENWTDVSFRYNTDGNETVDADDVQAYLDALVELDSPADLTDEVLKVAAGESAAVNVSVTLDAADKEYFDTYYENGCYVEGYSFLTALNTDGVDLSLPYLGFYGGWDEAPVFDAEDVSEFYMGENGEDFNQYYSILWSNFYGYDSYWVPGLNPYVDEDYIDPSHISLSPNGDGYDDFLDDIYLSLLRNADSLSITYSDAVKTDEDGNAVVYDQQTFEKAPKSYYSSSYGVCLPFLLSEYEYYGLAYAYDLTDENGDPLPNNTKINLTFDAVIDYEGAEHDVVNVPITVDTEAPELLDAQMLKDMETGTYYMYLTFRDNLSVAAVNLLSGSGYSILGQYAVEDTEAEVDEDGNLVWTQRYDITGLGDHFVVVLGDYALNESYYDLQAPGNEIDVDTSLLYGYRVADSYIYDDSLYGWISMEIVEDEDGATSVNTEVQSSEYYVDYALTAAEQIGGRILAVDANKDLVWIEPGYWDERTVIANLGVAVRDMAWDATTETLYAITNSNLLTIDIKTGELTYVGGQYHYFTNAYGLACDENGQLYGLYMGLASGQFRTIDKETGSWGETLLTGSDGMPGVYYSQSMTYRDGAFYWAQYGYAWYGKYGDLYVISEGENEGWDITDVGTIAGYAEVVGLIWLDNNEYDLTGELESLSVSPETASLVVGSSTTLSANKTPWYNEDKLTWISSDTSVATVNSSGKVTAVGLGEATITVSSGDISAAASVTVVDPQSELTGFVLTSTDYEIYNQWVSFTANAPAKYDALSENEGSVTFTSAEYVDGVIYAYDETSNFYTIDPEDYSYQKVATKASSNQIVDMSYDYTTGMLYGLMQDYNYGESYLVTIDRLTGKTQTVGTLSDGRYDMAVAIAADNNGVIYYVCDGYGFLCTYDPETGETALIGLTGYEPYSYIQSMTFDHDTGELYWAAFTSASFGILYVDVNTGVAMELGSVHGGSQITGLYTVPENPPKTPEVDVTSVTLTEDTVTVLEGGSTLIPVEVLPYNATERTVSWTVDDESVAVIENGQVIGVSVGTTTATGTLGEFNVTLTINVLESVGEFRSYVAYDFDYGSNGYWMSMFDYDIHTPGVDDFLYFADYVVTAAAYYDGYLYCYGEDYDEDDYENYGMHLQKVDAETGKVVADFSGSYDYHLSLQTMAFDYSQGTMYAMANAKNTANNSTLYAFDLSDGTLYPIAALNDYLVAMACSEDGTLYAVNTSGTLYTVDKVTGALTVVGETGYAANSYQSMAFDYDSGNLYWAQSNYVVDWWGDSGAQESNFLLVDTEDASAVKIGEQNGLLLGLYFPMENEPVVPETVEVSGLSLSASDLLLTAGESEQLTVMLLPVSVREISGEVTFTSSDETVATVSADGTVTAVDSGTATITASCGSVSATCTVNVVGENDLLYAVNSQGWSAVPVLDPTAVKDSKTLAEETGLTIVAAAYNSDDGYVYAVGADGYLWKLTLDLGTVEKVGDTAITESDAWMDYIAGTANVLDLAFNPYSGKLYVLVGDYYSYYDDYYDWLYESWDGYYLAEIDTTDGSVEVTGTVSWDVGYAQSITFNSADTALVYDSYTDYIYEVSVTGGYYDSAKQILWVQGQNLVADADLGAITMVYSKDLNRLFLKAVDDYYGDGTQAVYLIDLDAGSVTKLGSGAWDQSKDVLSLLLIEGAEPAVTAEPDPAEGDEPETPAETEPAETEAEPETPAETEPEPETPAETEPEPETPAETDPVETEPESETPAEPDPVADLED